MRRIRLLQSVAGKDYKYGKGAEVSVPEPIAKDLCKGGLAVYIDGTIERIGGKPGRKKEIETAESPHAQEAETVVRVIKRRRRKKAKHD